MCNSRHGPIGILTNECQHLYDLPYGFSYRTYFRQLALSEVILEPTNSGVNIFQKLHVGLVKDLMFASDTLSNDLQWHVSEKYTHSDHLLIIFQGESKWNQKKKTVVVGWTSMKLNKQMLQKRTPMGDAVEVWPKRYREHLTLPC